MKIRNGFVSNSSSSSFLVAYDKSKILTKPEDIVKYIDENPRNEITFKSDANDGWDFFTLDMHQKNYLLNHKERFIKYNQGTVSYTDYGDWDEEYAEGKEYPEIQIPRVQALTEVYRCQSDEYEYRAPDVDMSDMELPATTIEDSIKVRNGEADDETTTRVKKSDEWYKTKENRERTARRQARKKAIEDMREELLKSEKVDPENLVVEYMNIDYNSCDPDGSYDSEFAERYFGLDSSTYYDKPGTPATFREAMIKAIDTFKNSHKDIEGVPYTDGHSLTITDLKEIIENLDEFNISTEDEEDY